MTQNKKKKSLATQNWKEVTINHVIHAFLQGEFDDCIKCFGPLASGNRALIDNPDFTNESQNSKRTMLISFRAPLLLRIPCSTTWYKVCSLEEFHLDELLVIGRCGWDDNNDRNEILNVARRKKLMINSYPSEWSTPILWGHAKEGPFTIIDGNHRLVAYAYLNQRPKISIPVYVGLSDDLCVWHLPDLIK